LLRSVLLKFQYLEKWAIPAKAGIQATLFTGFRIRFGMDDDWIGNSIFALLVIDQIDHSVGFLLKPVRFYHRTDNTLNSIGSLLAGGFDAQ
jgi:hypothetical protein